MLTLMMLFATSLFAQISAQDATQEQFPEPIRDVRVFYSGHSLLNLDLPFMVSRAARAFHVAHAYNEHMGLGSSMQFRLQNPTSGQDRAGVQPLPFDMRDEIRTGSSIGSVRYNTLVVTESVGDFREGGVWLSFLYNHSVASARAFYNLLNEGNPEPTRAFLYEVWPHRTGGSLAAWKNMVRDSLTIWECIASGVNATRQGRPAMQIIPGAQALVRLINAIQARQVGNLTRWQDLFHDDVHLSDLGNYYMAMVVFSALHGTSSEGLRPPRQALELRPTPYVGIPQPGSEELRRIQEIAYESVVDYQERTRVHRGVNQCRDLMQAHCIRRGQDAGYCGRVAHEAF